MTPRTRPRWRHTAAGLLAVRLAAGVTSGARAIDPLVLDHGHIDTFDVSVDGGGAERSTGR